MRNILPLSLILLFITSTTCYSLEGEWTLLSVNDKKLNIQTQITQFIFRGQQIVNKLQFKTCKSLLYQVDVQQNNFYVLRQTEWVNHVRPCTQQQLNNVNLIRTWIRRILKFRINFNQLIIADPSQDPVFIFQRNLDEKQVAEHKSITGQWIVHFVDNPKTSHIMIADGNQISICSGAIFNYSINYKYYIRISSNSKGSCKDVMLLSNLRKGIFYQQFGKVLQVFDNRINLLFSAVKKPEGRTQIPRAPTPIVQTKQINTKPTAESGFSSGQYFALLLFHRGLGRRRTQITQSTITLQLCSILTFTYKIKGVDEIDIRSDSIYDENCPKTNQKRFFQTILSGIKYKVDTDGAINLIDKDGKEIVAFNPE